MQWSAEIELLDWLALGVFGLVVTGYRFFLATMLKSRPDRLFLGKLQAYRNAWITTHSGNKSGLLVVQSMRNTIMSASFLASTAILLIMGAFNLLSKLDSIERTVQDFHLLAPSNRSVELLKILLIIITLSYTFFNFMWYIREVNYMTFILNIPKDRLDEIERGDSTHLIAKIFLTSGIHFSLGMRGYYFLIPLFLWLFNPVLMIASSVIILYILFKRDLAK